jgi:serine/threonine-protein kinase
MYKKHWSNGTIFYIPDEVIGESGNTYVIDEYINIGGNGVVYKFIEQDSGEECAIKFLLSSKDNDRQRFQQEIDVLRSVSHDHIVKYIDSGNVEALTTYRNKNRNANMLFVVIELANHDLKFYLESKNFRIGSEEYLGQIRGLSSALSIIHETTVHRDIKPGNILVCGERWVLTDFGLCSRPDNALNLTREREHVGPRYWMSPEANNKVLGITTEICRASDVFQLASVFWLIINGFHPTGILKHSDWTGPEPLFEVLSDALHYDKTIRPEDGHRFYELVTNAIMSI